MRAPSWLVFFAVATACKGSPPGPGPVDASGSTDPARASASAEGTVDGGAGVSVGASADSGADADADAGADAGILAGDGGASVCRVVRGPIELPVRSPVVLAMHGDSVEVVMNSDGKPRISSFATGPLPAAPAVPVARESADGGATSGYPVACALAGDRVFCADRSGAVHRTSREGAGDRLVASSRTGSRIAAAPLGGNHAALGYLASRQTSEGWVSEAWLAVDDDPPVRLSEDGSGATSLVLLPRKTAVVSLSVDARAALTALHVRPVTFEGRATLGEDVVVFVGGPGDHRTAGALSVSPAGPGWALLPIAKDIGSFGMAVVRVDDPARVDEPVQWSMYPNGLDPAPVATAIDGGKTWVARVRPQGREPGSTRVLEMGIVSPEGAFVAKDVVATAAKMTEVALLADPHGGLWASWVEGSGSWLERLVCR